MTANYIAIVLGEELIDEPIDFDDAAAGALALGDDEVVVLHGDPEGVTVLVRADDESDAERRILATFGDVVTIDDLAESLDQEPFTIADCGCVAWGDGTGSPCSLHNPNNAAADALVAHALSLTCVDPDCEIHHPEVAVAEGVASTSAIAWFLAGAIWGRENPEASLAERMVAR